MTTQALSSEPKIIHAWLVVLTAGLFFFYIFINMNLFNAISGELVAELRFNAKQLGFLAAFYFYGNVIFLFPAGCLLDRFSVKKLLLTAFIVTIISTYIFSTTSNFWVMSMTRLVIGLAGAFALLPAIKLTSRWFTPNRMAFVLGIVVTMGMIGGTVSQTPLALLTQHFGWRHAMQIVTALGILLSIAQLIILRDEPKGAENDEITEHVQLKQLGFWRSLGIVIKNQQNWLSGIYISLVNLPLFVLAAWGTPFLTKVHNFTYIQTTLVTSMLFIGMMFGSPLAGAISDKMKLRKLPMLIGAVAGITAILIIMFSPAAPLWIVACQFLFLGIIMGAQVIGYPVIAESNPHTVTATASSLSSVLIMSGGTLIPIYSWLLSLSNPITYSLTDFIRANCMMLTGLIIALIAALLIKETHCKNYKT